MGRVKQMYQSMMDSRTLYDNVPVEYTMSSNELEDFEFDSNLDSINSELQILSNLDLDDQELS